MSSDQSHIDIQNIGGVEPHSTFTMDEVVNSILALARLDEAQLAELVSSGNLRSQFPFRVQDSVSPPLRHFSDATKAPDRPLMDEEYQRFLRGG